MARALGVWSAVAGAGGATGSILGGVLTAELSWRWVLFVNIPIGAAAIAAAVLFLSEARGGAVGTGRAPKLDVVGAVTVTAGLGVLIYAVTSISLAIAGAGAYALLVPTLLVPLPVPPRPSSPLVSPKKSRRIPN